MNTLKAGVARANITPPVGTIANGGKPSVGIATELYAKALVLDDGQTQAALVTADVLLLGKQVVAETRARIEAMTGIPGAHVMFAASHTHSGAATTMRERWSTIEPDHSYVDQLVAKMAGAVAEAHSRQVEASVGTGKGHAAASINRWISTPEGAQWAPNPAGAVDDNLSVLRVDDLDGRPLAALVNYAAHASVMSWGKLFAADYPGFLQSVVEKVYDDRITVLFANGASGDTKIKWLRKKEDGSDDFGYGDVEDARRWGTVLAGEAIKTYEQILPAEAGSLRVSSKEIQLPMLPLPSVEEVEAELEATRKRGEDTTWEERTLASLRAGTAPTSITGEIQVLRIGSEIVLVAVPGELFAEVGLRMRRELDCEHLFIIGYANGYTGYLPTAASCREDGDRPRYDWHKFFWYPACFSEGVEPAILEAVRELVGVVSDSGEQEPRGDRSIFEEEPAWVAPIYDYVDARLQEYPASFPPSVERQEALMVLDGPLHLHGAPRFRSTLAFLRRRLQRTIEEIEHWEVREGARIWRLYNMGFVVRTPTATLGMDLVGGWRLESDGELAYYGISEEWSSRLADQLDVLTISQSPGSHGSVVTGSALRKRGACGGGPRDLRGTGGPTVVASSRPRSRVHQSAQLRCVTCRAGRGNRVHCLSGTSGR